MGNFKFLKKDYPELYQLCSDVAKYIDSDKSISMLKARQAIEFIVKYLGSEADDLFVNINNLEDKNIANSRIIDLFHLIRKKANKSVHNEGNTDTEGVLDALTEICVWLTVGHDQKNISIIQFNDKEKFFLRKNGYCDDKSVVEDFDVSDAINPLEAVGKFSDEDVEPTDALEQDVFETYEEYCERIESMPPVKIGYAFLDSSQIDEYNGMAFPLFHVSKHSKIEAASVNAFYTLDISQATNIDGILTAKLKIYEEKIYYDYDSVTLQDDNYEIPLSPVSWEKYDYETKEQYARRISNLPLLPVAIAKPIRKEYDLQKQILPFETISLSYASKYFNEKRILCSVDRDNAKKLCLTKSPFKIYARIKDIQAVDELHIFNKEQDIVLIVKNNQTTIKDLVDLQFELYVELAQQGNVDALCKLAQCYEYGDGIEKNDEKAFEWYKKAAEHGHREAQYGLAKCYENGWGIEENEEKAFEWYKRAVEQYKRMAEQGDIDAQYKLAHCYDYGDGIEKNDEKAFEWYKKAAEHGHIEAQYGLAECYVSGWGIEKNDEKAFEWYKRAVEQYKRMAEQGDIDAQCKLAEYYENGWGIEENEEKAFEWYKKAAEHGHREAQYGLALCYENGWGIEKNDEKAFEWYKKAAEHGHRGAQYGLAECYENGRGKIG